MATEDTRQLHLHVNAWTWNNTFFFLNGYELYDRI